MRNAATKYLVLFGLLVVLGLNCQILRAGNFWSETLPVCVKNYNSSQAVPGGIACIGDVTISFEDLIQAGKISVSAATGPSSPSGSILPDQVTPIASFGGLPVWVTIEHDQTLMFTGVVNFGLNIPIETENLGKTRLFKSSGCLGCTFDLIGSVGIALSGMSAGGDGSAFSEFVLAIDERPLPEVINLKLFQLWDSLDTHTDQIDPKVFNLLETTLFLITDAWGSRDFERMNEVLLFFDEQVRSLADLGFVPSLDTTNQGDENIAGQLRATAHGLNYLLALLLTEIDS